MRRRIRGIVKVEDVPGIAPPDPDAVKVPRIAGLKGFETPTLEGIERRRGELLALTLVILIAFAVAAGWLLASAAWVMRRLLTAPSSRAAEFEEGVRRSLRGWARRGVLNDAATLSSLVLWLSAASLAVSWWYFWPLMRACIEPISRAPAEQLALLAPAFLPVQDLYRMMFTGLIVVVALSWYVVLKLAGRQGRRLSRGVVTGGAAVFVLTLATLDFPYRLLRHAVFEAARWNGQACYITGERAADVQLFCPNLQPPRNRVVRKEAGGLERLGFKETIFARFAPAEGNAIP
jgi:hypothetical protein